MENRIGKYYPHSIQIFVISLQNFAVKNKFEFQKYDSASKLMF